MSVFMGPDESNPKDFKKMKPSGIIPAWSLSFRSARMIVSFSRLTDSQVPGTGVPTLFKGYQLAFRIPGTMPR